MGKIISVTYLHKHVENQVNKSEWAALYATAALTVMVCFAFPTISTQYIEPYLRGIYTTIDESSVTILSQGNVMIMMIMMGLILVLPFSLLYYRMPRKHLSPYMGGRTTTAEMRFSGSAGLQRDLALRNYYLESFFGENKLFRVGAVLCLGLLLLMFGQITLPGVF
jgi:ech hydrogenase subunit A